MCAACEFNQAKAEGFAEKLLQILNSGSLALMMSIGHRVGLFDTMRDMGPATSEEIAGASGLNERYVREWLNAMTVGRILEVDDKAERYQLPPEHSGFLTRANPTDNMALFAQYIPILGQVEDRIIGCFKNGGGVSYDKYERFHEVMAEDSGQSVLSSLIQDILPLVPGIIQKLEKGIKVLDVGCGSGKALNLMAQTYPNSEFVGYDLCAEPLEVARKDAMEKGLSNITFEQVDLTYARTEISFDFITAFDAIHDQARPDKVLQFIYGSLREDGAFLMQDIDASENVNNNMDHPLGPLLYTVSTMHCMTVSLAQDGMGLGTMWGTEKAQRMLKEAGFNNVKENRLEHDIQNCYFVCRGDS